MALTLQDLDRFDIRLGIRLKAGTITLAQYNKSCAVLDALRARWHRRNAQKQIRTLIDTAKADVSALPIAVSKKLASHFAKELVFLTDELVEATLKPGVPVSKLPPIKDKPPRLGSNSEFRLGKRRYDPLAGFPNAWNPKVRAILATIVCGHGKLGDGCKKCKHLFAEG